MPSLLHLALALFALCAPVRKEGRVIAAHHTLMRGGGPEFFIRSTGSYTTNVEKTSNGSTFDTGVMPTPSTIVEIMFRITPGSTRQHWPYLLGAQTANDNANTFSVRGNATTNTSPPWTLFRWGHTAWHDMGLAESWGTNPDWHVLRLSQDLFVLDETEYDTSGFAKSGTVPGVTMAIGSIHRASSFQNCLPHDIKSLKIWEGSTLLRDLSAELNGTTPGMRCAVTGSFFSSVVTSYPYQLLEDTP